MELQYICKREKKAWIAISDDAICTIRYTGILLSCRHEELVGNSCYVISKSQEKRVKGENEDQNHRDRETGLYS